MKHFTFCNDSEHLNFIFLNFKNKQLLFKFEEENIPGILLIYKQESYNDVTYFDCLITDEAHPFKILISSTKNWISEFDVKTEISNLISYEGISDNCISNFIDNFFPEVSLKITVYNVEYKMLGNADLISKFISNKTKKKVIRNTSNSEIFMLAS